MKRIISLLMTLMLICSSVTANADVIVNSTGVSFAVQEMAQNHELNRFLREITVIDPETKQEVTDGKFVKDKEYTFRLKFQEGNYENQFTVDASQNMIYTYPDGLNVTAKPGQLDVKTTDGKVIGVYEIQQKQLVFTPYYSSDNGKTFHPRGENETGKTYAELATNTSIEFDFNAKLTGDSGKQEIKFGDNVTKEWTIVPPDKMPKAEGRKEATYDAKTKKLYYTVTATVRDNPTDSLVIRDDLKLSDYIKGIDTSTFVVKKKVANGEEETLKPEAYEDKLVWSATNGKTDGFTLTFGHEEKDTTYTITYEVPLDEDKLKELSGTVTVGENHVKVDVDGDKDANDVPWWGANVKGEKPIHKTFVGKDTQDYSKLKWKLVIGYEQNETNIAGRTVTDSWKVTENADAVSNTTFVSGSGKITLHLADGTTQVIDGTNADQYFVQNAGKQNEFTFTVPGTSEKWDVRWCEVEYETDCEYKDETAVNKPNVKVENTAKDEDGNSSSTSGSAGGQDPTPPTPNSQVNKTVRRDENGDYVYEVTVVVPKEWIGKTGFYLKDVNYFVDTASNGVGIDANPKKISIHAQGLGSADSSSMDLDNGFGDYTYQVYTKIDWTGRLFYIGFNIPENTSIGSWGTDTLAKTSSWKWDKDEDVTLTIRYTFDQNEKVLGNNYEERGNLNEVDRGYLRNEVEIGGGGDKADIDLTKSIRKSAKVSDSVSNIVEYTVDINMKETSPIPLNATFTDTFSKQMEYVPDSLRIYIMAYADWNNSWEVAEVKCKNLKTDVAGQISFQFKGMGSDWEYVRTNAEWAVEERFGSVEELKNCQDWYRHSYAQHGKMHDGKPVVGYPYIQVKYQLRPTSESLKPDNPLYVNNTASVSGWGSASTTVELTPKVLTKDMAVNQEGTEATFTLHVNPGGNQLGTGKLKLIDKLTNATLLTSTIEVKDSGGKAISRGSGADQYQYQYDLATNTLTMELPNAKHLIVTYTAKPNGITGETVTVSNNAQLEGVNDSSSSTGKSFTIVKSSATSSQYPIRFLINKVDQDKRPLPGAKFEVYHVRKNTTGETWVLAGSFTSNDNGEIQIEIKEDEKEATYSNELYKIVEVSAPANYRKADPVYVCIEDTTNSATYNPGQDDKFKALITSLDRITNPQLNVLKNWGGVQIINEKIQGYRFSFTKTDANGNALSGATFTLKDMSTEDKEADKTATSGEDGTVSFDDLKPGKTYQLEETRAPGGYLLSTVKWKIEVGEHGEITVKDEEENAIPKPDKGYQFANREMPTLPSVGGQGTAVYSLLGLALMAMATAAAYTLTRRKRARRAE